MNDAPAKPRALARLPRGFIDRAAAEVAAAEAMIARVREVYRLYGFEAVETPFVEYTDALGKFLPDQDRPNEGVFSFQDDDEQWLSLRYDLTAPLARYVAENYDKLPKPYRSMRSGWVFRNEKPGPGRFRQFMQLDADTVGSSSPAADAEICMMAADSFERLGLSGQYAVKVSNRKVLDGLMEALGLGGPDNAHRRMTVLRAIDKTDRLGAIGVSALLGEGRWDGGSKGVGDFTKGAGLDPAQIERILWYIGGANPKEFSAQQGYGFDPNYRTTRDVSDKALFQIPNADRIDRLRAVAPTNATFLEGLGELEEVSRLVRSAGFSDSQIGVDPAVVRGLEYYTGPVFEAEVFLKDESGKPISFGSVGGGGRYDGLVARFRDAPVPATGFSIGVSRLVAALRAIKSPILDAAETQGPVVVCVLDRDHLASYQRLVAALRGAGVAAEMYLGESGLNAQLKYADRRSSRVAVIQGSNERDAAGGPQVVVRDLKLGAEIAKMNKDRAEYLELRAKAQMAVAEADLVATVKAVLAR
jgi:histidyl-tRNA synthetase